MADQLLWFETILKGSIGIILLLAPITLARIAGLPHGNTSLWPRLFGATLVGIAAAFAVEGYNQINEPLIAKGIGLAGAVVINLTAILALLSVLIFKGVSSKRAYALIWVSILVLLGLMLFEIAHA